MPRGSQCHVCPQRFLIDLSQAIKGLYINLVDLEHEGHRGNVGTVQQFQSEVALSEYTLGTKKVFNRRRVPKRSLLKLLLRNILYPQSKKAGKIEWATIGRNLRGKQNDVKSKQLEKRSD